MASPVFIGSMALVAGYLAATRHKSEPASTETPNAGANEAVAPAKVAAAAESVGEFVAPTGTMGVADGNSFVADPVAEGSTSCTPSGGTISGDTSLTPSGGTAHVTGIGSTNELIEGSPSGPSGDALTPTPDTSTLPLRIRYGSLAGLTRQQESTALLEEGPALQLVW